MRTRRPTLALVPLVLSTVLVGCGSEASPGGQDADAVGSAPTTTTPPAERLPESVLTTESGELLVTCGVGRPFPVSAPTEGIEVGTASAPIQKALDDLAGGGGLDAPAGLRSDDDGTWRALAMSSEQATVAVGKWGERGSARGGSVVVLEKDGAGWKAVSWGDCRLVPAIEPGLSWTDLSSARRPDPADTEIEIGVTERECTSGRDPIPFLQQPDVVETADAVTVYWTTKSATGAQNCVGPAPTLRTITLLEPIGDRDLLDGSSWPARPVE